MEGDYVTSILPGPLSSSQAPTQAAKKCYNIIYFDYLLPDCKNIDVHGLLCHHTREYGFIIF